MKGYVLNFDTHSKMGSISGVDGNRYSFEESQWKDSVAPIKEQEVDFVLLENKATEIFVIKNSSAENTSILLGLVAIGITFFFGFIGTFISRLVISKESFGSSIIPALLHLLSVLLILIPFVGWIIYFIITMYFMYKNYKLAMNRG